jgi:hypothetical protein
VADDGELARKVRVARSQLKHVQRTVRTLSGVLADLEDSIDAQPNKEGTANGNSNEASATAGHAYALTE